MTQRTPGPWTEFQDDDSHDIIARDGSHVARVEPRNGLDPMGEQVANACLIAAAPDLFAVALALQEWGRQLGGWEAPVWAQLDAAIIKARPSLPRFRVDGKDKYGAWLGIGGNGDLIAAPFAIFDSDTQDHLPERFDSGEAAQAVADKLNSEPTT